MVSTLRKCVENIKEICILMLEREGIILRFPVVSTCTLSLFYCFFVYLHSQAHITSILRSKFSSFRNFDTALYTCAPEFDFLDPEVGDLLFFVRWRIFHLWKSANFLQLERSSVQQIHQFWHVYSSFTLIVVLNFSITFMYSRVDIWWPRSFELDSATTFTPQVTLLLLYSHFDSVS